MRDRSCWTLAAVTAVLATFAVESPAFAGDEREQCAAAAEQAQQLRDEGKYRRAREQMLVCARDVCPGPIKSDCGKWLGEIDRDAPTVVFGAKNNTGDLTDVKVTMDGITVQDKLDGKPVLVDTGEHTFKFQTPDGQTQEQKVVLRAAEKARPVLVTFGGGPTSGTSNVKGAEQDGGSSLVLPIALAGVAVVALGSFAFFGLAGKSDVDNLQACKPHCAETKVDGARTKLIVADISLGVGVVAAAVSAYLFITRPKTEATVKTGNSKSQWWSNVRVDGGPIAGGAMTGLSASF